LALALATLAAPRSRVETLFLDEGFGTLDAQNLEEQALGALDALQAAGCQVGVISHVDGIAERIGAQVEVQPDGAGQSRVISSRALTAGFGGRGRTSRRAAASLRAPWNTAQPNARGLSLPTKILIGLVVGATSA
jgi:exonuclease SbcC